MSHAHAGQVTRTAEVRFVLLWILFANVAVVVAKLVVGLRSDSLAIVGDAMHSSVDSVNNVLALVVMSVAALGPDEDHPYGHQKFETLGALAIVGFLSVTGFELTKGAIHRLISGAPPLHLSNLQLGILISTLFINIGVATYEARKGRQLDSEILLADAAHTKADVFVTLGVLSGVSLSFFGFSWADPVVAIAVAIVIMVLAWSILSRCVPVLVDEQVVPASDLRSSAEAIDGVRSAYTIRSRGSRFRSFAELTISVDRQISVEAAHRTADAVETELRTRFGIHEITVHVEPC